MTLVPDWWSEYSDLNATNELTIRDASGNLVVFDPNTESGINPVQDLYVANNFALPSAFLSQVANIPATGNTVGLPASPINVIAAQYDLIIPGDDVGSIVGRIREAAVAIWGSDDIGVVRQPSGYMYADPTSGVRPGSIIAPRVVLPPHAAGRNGRGF